MLESVKHLETQNAHTIPAAKSYFMQKCIYTTQKTCRNHLTYFFHMASLSVDSRLPAVSCFHVRSACAHNMLYMHSIYIHTCTTCIFICMCTRVCTTYVYMYVHVCTCKTYVVHAHIYLHAHIHTCTVYIYIHAQHVCTYVCAHMCMHNICIYVYACVHNICCTCTYIHTCTTCIYIHMCTVYICTRYACMHAL